MKPLILPRDGRRSFFAAHESTLIEQWTHGPFEVRRSTFDVRCSVFLPPLPRPILCPQLRRFTPIDPPTSASFFAAKMRKIHKSHFASAPIKSECRISNTELRISKLPRLSFFHFDIQYSIFCGSIFLTRDDHRSFSGSLFIHPFSHCLLPTPHSPTRHLPPILPHLNINPERNR